GRGGGARARGVVGGWGGGRGVGARLAGRLGLRGARRVRELTMAKERYTAHEAAAALGISLDTLRRWDKAGRIKVERDGNNRRIVSAHEIDRMRGDGAGKRIS